MKGVSGAIIASNAMGAKIASDAKTYAINNIISIINPVPKKNMNRFLVSFCETP